MLSNGASRASSNLATSIFVISAVLISSNPVDPVMHEMHETPSRRSKSFAKRAWLVIQSSVSEKH